jgi:hypothetical protein
MACLICNGVNAQATIMQFDKPDMYETYMGIEDVHRTWHRCANCGHYHQGRNYDIIKLDEIYKSGYRDKDFRGKDIGEAYKEISSIPWGESENKNRAEWFVHKTFGGETIDIGAGIGVFPSLLKDYGYPVECVEENKLSLKFINETLGIKCYDKIPTNEYWNVSLVHVLEHITEPDLFLNRVRKICKRHLFVEVPDAREFASLPKDSDEFNSCHVWFFTLQNLITLIERNGFKVFEASRMFYPKRKLSRILVLAVIQ